MDEYARQASGLAASVNEVGLGNKQHDVVGQRRSGRHRMRRRVRPQLLTSRITNVVFANIGLAVL